MASTTRDRPRIRYRFSSTPSIAVTAPTATRTASQGGPSAGAAIASSVACARVAPPSRSAPTAPNAAIATRTYNRVAITTVATTARGIVRRGSRTSTPSVAMRP